MKVPPYAVALRVAEPERTRFCAWLPLFILWPLLLALVLLALVVTVAVDTRASAGRPEVPVHAFRCWMSGGCRRDPGRRGLCS